MSIIASEPVRVWYWGGVILAVMILVMGWEWSLPGAPGVELMPAAAAQSREDEEHAINKQNEHNAENTKSTENTENVKDRENAAGVVMSSSTPPHHLRLSAGHMIIVEPTMREVALSYFFGVENRESQDQSAQIAIMYPQQMTSVQPLAGLEDHHLGFDEQLSRVVITKEFAPGTHVYAVRFLVDAGSSHLQVAWHLPEELPSLSVLRGATHKFAMIAPGFRGGLPSELKHADLSGIVSEGKVPPGEWVVSFQGLPQDRRWFYGLGIAIIGLMLSVTFVKF